MSGEGINSGNGYEHAGGFKSALTLRSLILATVLIGALLVGQNMIERAYGREAGTAFFYCVMCMIVAITGVRDIANPQGRRDAGAPESLRTIRIGGIIWLTVAGAFAAFFVGALIDDDPTSLTNGRFDAFLGFFVLAMGLWMLLFQRHFHAWRKRRYDARLAARRTRGTDAYFEELRELEAYPPSTGYSTTEVLLGALLIVIGGALIATSLGEGAPR